MVAVNRKEEIILSAIKVFSEKNYNASTTAEIAREAGISEGTLYKHFSSKKELFLECARYTAALLLDRYIIIYDKCGGDYGKYLLGVATDYIDFVYDSPTLCTFLSCMLNNTFDEEILSELKQFVNLNISINNDMIKNAKEIGQIDLKAESNPLAWIFVGGYFTIILMRECGMSKDECRSVIENILPAIIKTTKP